MKHPFKGAARKFAAVSAIALVASVVPVSMSSAAKVQAPKQGGEITVGVFNRLLSTCYTPNAANSALGIMKSVFEGLVEQRADGRIVPYLAESVTPSADYKTWTVKVRPGIKFHTGEALDAAAVVLNINTLIGLTFLSNPAGLGHTGGSTIPFTANIRGAQAIGTDTVAIALYNPAIDFLESLYGSGRFFMRAPSNILNPTLCATKGAGTGPFMFESTSPETNVVVRNPNYWRKDKNGAQLPYLNKITFKFVEQPSQRASGLRSASLDAAMFTSVGEIKQIISVQSDRNLQMILSPDDFYPTFWPNQAIEPFNNKNARLAFAHAWDNDTYYKLRNCFKGKCLGKVPQSIVGTQNIMHNKAGFLKHDVKKAKEYAAAYKAETGKDLTFQLNADTSAESQANAKAAQQILKKSGINTTVLVEDIATQVAKAFPATAEILQGKLNPYQAYPVLLFEGRGTSFTLPFVQSNVFRAPGNGKLALTPLFSAIGAGLNVTRHRDAALDELVWSALSDVTKARTAKLKAITKYIQENAVLIPTPTQQYGFGFSKKLKGFDKFILASGGQGRPMTNAGVNWTGVYIEQ